MKRLGAAMVVGLSYAAVGVSFAALSNEAASHETRIAWRLGAWAVSAALFAAHVGFESLWLRSSSARAAAHASLGAAVGAFGLAVAALVHSQRVHAPSELVHRLFVALAAWPLIAALPAFLVALGLAATLARVGRRA